jgi:hypothetical protein
LIDKSTSFPLGTVAALVSFTVFPLACHGSFTNLADETNVSGFSSMHGFSWGGCHTARTADGFGALFAIDETLVAKNRSRNIALAP